MVRRYAGEDARRRLRLLREAVQERALVDAVREAVWARALGERGQGSTTREEGVTSIEPLRAGHTTPATVACSLRGTLGKTVTFARS